MYVAIKHRGTAASIEEHQIICLIRIPITMLNLFDTFWYVPITDDLSINK